MDKNFIRRIPAVEGVYGERIVINSKVGDLYGFFKLISFCTSDSWIEEDNSFTVVWELPVGVSIDNNSLIRRAIKRAGVNIEEG